MLPEPNYPARPEQFIGRATRLKDLKKHSDTASSLVGWLLFAVLGDWGIGKSSLLFKFASVLARSEHKILPVSLSVGTDFGD